MGKRCLAFRRWSPCLVLHLALLGCADLQEEPDRLVEDDEWPCEVEGFPCTWEEVDSAVAERTFDLGEEALDRFTGTAQELIAWIEEQPGVAEVSVEEPTVIRLRLEGGRPVFVEVHGRSELDGLEGSESVGKRPNEETPSRTASAHAGTHTHAPPVTQAHAGLALSGLVEGLAAGILGAPVPLGTPLAPVGVTGRDRNSDRKINQRDQRKALVLDPMYWEWCYYDLTDWVDLAESAAHIAQRRRRAAEVCDGERAPESFLIMDEDQGIPNPDGLGYEEYVSRGTLVAAELEKIEAYQGNVTHLINDEVTLAAFNGWEQYDVIHLASHGTRSSMTLGAAVNRGNGPRARGPLARRRGLDPWLATTWNLEGAPRKWVWSADRRFFRALYPRGLDRTLFYASTCNTLGNPNGPPPPVARQLLGRESMFVGWGGSPNAPYDTIAMMFYRLAGEGWTGEEVIRRLPVVMGSSGYGDPIYADRRAYNHEATESQMQRLLRRGRVFGSHGTNMRIREVAKLVYPTGGLVNAGPDGLGWEDDEPATDGSEEAASAEPDASDTQLRRAVVRDGDDLNALLHGVAGDGVDDHLRVSVEVTAILPRQADSTTVHLELDGRQIGEARKLSEGENAGLIERHGVHDAPFHYLHFNDIPLGRDLQDSTEYELEVVVALPEGGESRYSARLKAGPPCSWNATISGLGMGRRVVASWGWADTLSSTHSMDMVPHTVWLEGDPQPETPWLEIDLTSVGALPRDQEAWENIAVFRLMIPGVHLGDVGTYNRVWGSFGLGETTYRGNADYLNRDLVGIPHGSGIGHLLTTSVTLIRNDEFGVEGSFTGRFLDLERFEEADRHPLGVGIHPIDWAQISASGEFNMRRDDSCRMRMNRDNPRRRIS